MDGIMAEFVREVELGKVQEFGGMSVIPLFTAGDSHDYLTLKEAMEANLITITELDQQGMVPELKVKNHADIPVLILDGEELAGAKQNRVLNTTILLKEKSETVIPVSCTEQGRWRYTTPEFKDSGVVAAHRIRRSNLETVHQSLRMSGEYRSDQRAVWNAIEDLSDEAKVKSETRAMRDVYQDRMRDLNEYLESFPSQAGQKGLLVVLDGEVVGLDLVSSSQAYSLLHEKLVKSYSMEAILREGDSSEEVNNLVEGFLEDVRGSTGEKHASVGYGVDYRFEGNHSVGSSLVYKDQVIHAAFFSKDDLDQDLSSYRQRRSYRL
jgi:GTP cyclohydrolase II